MRLISIISLLLASTTSVLAQHSTTTAATPAATNTGNYECDAENIVDACIASIQPQVTACGPNEWACLCEQTNNLLTCYNNCPGHPDQFGVQQQKTSYCNAAGPLTSTTKTATATSTSTSTGTGSGSSTSTGGSENGPSSTPTPETDAGVKLGVGMGGGLVGLVALGLVL